MNGLFNSFNFVAISVVSRWSVSYYPKYCVLNVRARCFSIYLIFTDSSAKFLLWISMDDGTFGYVLSSFGVKVETDVVINGCFAPFWLIGTQYLNLAAWCDHWWIWWCYSSYVVASEDFSKRNISVELFCLICCKISTKQPISRFSFWKFSFRVCAIQFIIFSEVLIEDSNGR